jgi:hypothetical protein
LVPKYRAQECCCIRKLGLRGLRSSPRGPACGKLSALTSWVFGTIYIQHAILYVACIVTPYARLRQPTPGLPASMCPATRPSHAAAAAGPSKKRARQSRPRGSLGDGQVGCSHKSQILGLAEDSGRQIRSCGTNKGADSGRRTASSSIGARSTYLGERVCVVCVVWTAPCLLPAWEEGFKVKKGSTLARSPPRQLAQRAANSPRRLNRLHSINIQSTVVIDGLPATGGLSCPAWLPLIKSWAMLLCQNRKCPSTTTTGPRANGLPRQKLR